MILKHLKRVDFDPNIQEHRQAVMNFLRRRAWADSNFKFSYDSAYTSVANQVQDKLLKWYLGSEFSVTSFLDMASSNYNDSLNLSNFNSQNTQKEESLTEITPTITNIGVRKSL